MTKILLLAASMMLNTSDAEPPPMVMINVMMQEGDVVLPGPTIVTPEGWGGGKVIVGDQVEDPRGQRVETGKILDTNWSLAENGTIAFELTYTLREPLQKIVESGATLQSFTSVDYVVSGIAVSEKPIVFKLDDGKTLTVNVTKLKPSGTTYLQMLEPRELNNLNIYTRPGDSDGN